MVKEIFSRASIRKFEDRPVGPALVEKILHAAMVAPTASDQRTWEFYVVENKEVIEKLSKASPYSGCVANAPVAIVIAYRDGGISAEYNQIDCAIASENIWLTVESLGLGTVMIGIAPIEERMSYVEDVLGLPEDVHAFSIFPIGYPAKEKIQADRFDAAKVHYIK